MGPAAVHVTTICRLPRTSVTLDEAIGLPDGTTAADTTDGADWLTALVATTRKVYDVPLVSPVTVQVNAAVVQVFESGVDVTVYPVTAEPLPLDASHATVA